FRGVEENGSSGVQLDAQSVGFGGGMTKAVVADGAQPGGQDVTKIMANELDARQGFFLLAVVGGTIFPAAGDGGLGEANHARIIDGGASDVGPEIFDSRSAGTGGLNMHSPILAPDLRVHLPVMFFEQLRQVLAEGALQVRQVDQELGIFDAHKLALL